MDLDRFTASNTKNRDLYRSCGLGHAHFFDKETWGKDLLAVRASGGRGPGGGGYSAEFLAQTPLSARAQKDMHDCEF